MNIDEFLAPISPDNPCGENLEYDADFQAMGQASQGKAEQQFGDTIIPAEPADWNTVEKLATSLLGRTKDLRVMLALTHAWTRRRGLAGYADGLVLVQEALSRYWEQLYPLLEEYGETDPFYRINALAGLSDKSDLTVAVRNASLLRSNGDEISLRDAQALLDGTHVRLDMVIDGNAVVAQVADPGLAATAVGVAVHIDGFRGLGQAGDGEQAEGEQVFA